MLSSQYLHQSIDHGLHRGEHVRVRGIGVLQAEQVRHFLVDVDARAVVEALLQRAEHDVLALLEIGGGVRRLALLTGDLANELADRATEGRDRRSDPGLRGKGNRGAAELIKKK